MVLNNIENLLEKYENGETSLKEEAQLKDYFSQETVAPHLEMYKPMFQYFLVNHQEQFTKDIPLNTKKKFNYKWLSVAAVMVLMASIYFNGSFGGETFTDKEMQDYNKAKADLALVSKYLNKGTSKVSYLSVINKAGTPIDYLKEINDPMGRIFKNN